MASQHGINKWDGTWIAKKPPTYCREHGHRIRGFLNGIPLCDLCVDALQKTMPSAEHPHAD